MMIKMAEYAKRRKELMKKIDPNGLIILSSSPMSKRNGDAYYYYRQNSDLYYLTGFDEPETVAILIPKRKEGEFILFNRVRDREREIWDGYRAGQQGALETYGADQAFPIGELRQMLPDLIQDREEIHYAMGLDKHIDRIVMEAVNKVRGKIRSGLHSPIKFVDIATTLHEMRLIKSPTEIAIMRKAAEISSKAHLRAMQFCKPGINEFELEAEMTHEFLKNGARFSAYNSIVGSGANACVLHYINNNQVIQDKSLVLIDAGAEYQNYASDITRTFPANGKFTSEQKAIYDIVLEAQLAGIKAVRPGALWNAPQNAIVKIITQGLLDLGILKGNLQTLIEQEAYFPFYMHKSGHWLGLDVHDVGRYKIKGEWRPFEAGMVLTVEPGIYISADTPNVAPKWHNIGIRIEDDVVVTEKGNDILSHDLPKKTDDIEAVMEKFL